MESKPMTLKLFMDDWKTSKTLQNGTLQLLLSIRNNSIYSIYPYLSQYRCNLVILCVLLVKVTLASIVEQIEIV